VVAFFGDGSKRQLATATEGHDNRPLCGQRPASAFVMDRPYGLGRGAVVHSYFHGNDTLTRGWNALVERDGRRNTRSEAKASETRAGKHERIALSGIQLGEARIDVSADWRKDGSRRERTKLGGPAHASGADDRAGLEARERTGRRE
jgi:hypothetical protein